MKVKRSSFYKQSVQKGVIVMLKKIIKAIFKGSMSHHYHKGHYSSSDHYHNSKEHYSHTHPSHYGYKHYKKKHHSGSFFSSFFGS
jgi:hypothetical protein